MTARKPKQETAKKPAPKVGQTAADRRNLANRMAGWPSKENR